VSFSSYWRQKNNSCGSLRREPDLAAAGRAINQAGGETSPAIHFINIKGYQKAQLVMNVHGPWPNLALMLGMEKDASLR
jgi:3-polyprenyl-4-hydroxybenzoate decarboxylase